MKLRKFIFFWCSNKIVIYRIFKDFFNNFHQFYFKIILFYTLNKCYTSCNQKHIFKYCYVFKLFEIFTVCFSWSKLKLKWEREKNIIKNYYPIEFVCFWIERYHINSILCTWNRPVYQNHEILAPQKIIVLQYIKMAKTNQNFQYNDPLFRLPDILHVFMKVLKATHISKFIAVNKLIKCWVTRHLYIYRVPPPLQIRRPLSLTYRSVTTWKRPIYSITYSIYSITYFVFLQLSL